MPLGFCFVFAIAGFTAASFQRFLTLLPVPVLNTATSTSALLLLVPALFLMLVSVLGFLPLLLVPVPLLLFLLPLLHLLLLLLLPLLLLAQF